MSKAKRYSPEVGKRAIRMVFVLEVSRPVGHHPHACMFPAAPVALTSRVHSIMLEAFHRLCCRGMDRLQADRQPRNQQHR